jgi:transposase InsO family protein
MRIFNINKGVKGSRTIQECAIRFAYMISETAKKRAIILTFWKKYGTEATEDAYHVKERTLYLWQRKLRKGGGRLESLNPGSRAPKTREKRRFTPELVEAVVTLRAAHRGMGKDMMTPLLKAQGFNHCPSYIGYCIQYCKQRQLMREKPIKKPKRPKRIKIRRTEKRGFEIDTVVRFVDGVKTYILTAIMLEHRFAFAHAYRSHSSKSAAHFLRLLRDVSPLPVNEVQTDNGSEFELIFRDTCSELGIVQYHTYPRSPKMNAFIERFNRTLHHEFVAYNRTLMRDDIQAFNQKLVNYLLWYNTERPHSSLGFLSPLKYYMKTLSTVDCNMCWAST